MGRLLWVLVKLDVVKMEINIYIVFPNGDEFAISPVQSESPKRLL